MNNEKHDNRFWFGFFIGGLLGAILLFFMGTKEGKKTGKALEDKGKDLLEEFQDKVEEIKEKKEDLTDSAVEKMDTALAQIEKLQEQSVETTKHIRQRFFKNLPKRR